MNIFLIIILVSVVPIMFFVMRNEAKPKKNIVLGVTLPFLEREAPAVLDICARFKRALGLVSVVLVLLVVPCFFIESIAVYMIYLFTWLLVAIISIPAVFVVYRQKLMRYKRAHVLPASEHASVRVIDLETVDLKTPRINGAWFLPAVLISAVPLFLLWKDGAAFALASCGTSVILTALFYFIYRLIFRQRAELIDDRTELTAALTRVRRANYGIFCLVSAWLTGIFNLVLWLRIDNGVFILTATMIYAVLILALSLYTELKTRNMQSRLTVASGQGFYIDDDAYWLGGLLYYNPNDKKTLINDRTGIGISLNMARPAGMTVMVFSALIMLAMPFIGVWIMHIENTAPVLRIENGVLIASQTKDFCVLPLEDIDSVEKLNELPSLRRVNGNGMNTLLTGHFTSGDIGKCILCLDPTSAPFLLIRSGDNSYIVADRDPSVTESVYAELMSKENIMKTALLSDAETDALTIQFLLC